MAQMTITKQLQARVYASTAATFRNDLDFATLRLTPGRTASPCIQHERGGNERTQLPIYPQALFDKGPRITMLRVRR